MALEIWQYAALSEFSYRRDLGDQALLLKNIASNAVYRSVGADLQNVGLYTDGEMIINPANGLTAFVVESGGGFVVVFRGTDSGNPSRDFVINMLNDYRIDPSQLNPDCVRRQVI
tara:strand:+ start:1987 stop:2331 length:345 start_codon:yes stop_codon:yes gene_type:complete